MLAPVFLLFALAMPQWASAQSCHLPRQTLLQEVLAAVPLPKTLRERYYIAHEGGPIEFETCSRPRIRLNTSTRVCMAGNGSYPMHWVEDVDSAILQELSQLGVTEVRWICEANPGFNIARKLPKRLTLVLPTQAERINSGMRLEIPCITTREQWEFGAKAARDFLRGAKSDLPSTVQMFAAANRSLVETALRGKAESAQSQALTAGAFNLAIGLKYDWHVGGEAQSESQELAVFPELSMLARLKNIEDANPYWLSASEKAEKMTPHCSAPIDLALCQQEITKLQLLLMENGIWDERAVTGGGITSAQAFRDPRLVASALVRMRAETAQAGELKSRREADPGYGARVISETYPTQWETLVESTPPAYIKIDDGVHTAIDGLNAVIQPSCMLDIECAVRRAEVDRRLKSVPTETMKNGGCYKVTLSRFDGGETGHTWIEVSADHCKHTF